MRSRIHFVLEAIALLLCLSMIVGALIIGLHVSSIRACEYKWRDLGWPVSFVPGKGCVLLMDDGKWHSARDVYGRPAQEHRRM